ncbi:MAG: DNA repair protein RecN [Clostridia bacterium]|nr:DNA repair protein RecN [Clostridia bacterium]
MISTLHIKNIGIIEDLILNLNNGLNILTGETGAGKTLIIDSLQIATGGRFSKEMIRHGEEFSFVELSLYMPNHESNIDGNIIISREIHTNGRNSCKINGRLVTVTELKLFMQNLIDIHGQMDNQSLLDSNMHIKYLDDFIGENIKPLKAEYLKLYNEYKNLLTEIKNNFGDDKEKQRKLDLLRYQIKEIESADLKVGEDVEVENIRERIINSEKIQNNLNEVDNEIGETSIDSVSNAIRALERVENLDTKYENTLNTLKSIYYDLQELSRDVKAFKEEMEFDEEERQRVEERVDLIRDLKRKYGNDIEEILNYKEEISNEVEKIENSEKYILNLKKELKDVKEKMNDLSIKMNKIRVQHAEILSNKVNTELTELEMKNARFKVEVKFAETDLVTHSNMPDECSNLNKTEEYNKDGQDKVQFLISTNIGEEYKPLIKIASGGEMSRIMLGIKNVLADVDEVPVMVFDEIDTGISGKAAKSVGEKLKQIAKNHQVICITHQANIAAKGDYNYYISKNVEEGRTITNIKKLDEEETIREIARIASGDCSKVAIEHAKELRKIA